MRLSRMGHNRTARAGIDEVQNDEERDENKYKAQPEGGASRHAGDAPVRR